MPRPKIESSTGDYKPTDPKSRGNMLALFPPAPEPETELGRYHILSPRAGVRVSPLCLGAMSIGDQWTGFMGNAMGYEASAKFLDEFYNAGGNFIDTSNNYQDEQSEIILGEWMEKKGIRDEIVLATKYTTYALDRVDGPFKGIRANYGGNHKKNLHLTVESSLKKLRTSYIDILYLHWWEYSTSVEEVMHSLHALVQSGKVLYLGISDTPAWIVAQANQYAIDHALTPFVVYQGSWSLASRDLERDVIPMCRQFGMALAPYSVLGAGKFKHPKELEERSNLRGGMKPSENDMKVAKALEDVAAELGVENLTSVALAWARTKMTPCYPIIGGTSIANLKSNIAALKISLTDEQMAKLEEPVPFSWGFPQTGFGLDPHYLKDGKPNSLLVNTVAPLQYTRLPGGQQKY